MSHPITIQIPEPVFQSLQERAKQLGKTPEVVAAECVAQSVVSPEVNPLMKWIGAFEGPGDVAERHDDYIGDALAREMKGDANE